MSGESLAGWLHLAILALVAGIAGADVWRGRPREPWRARACLGVLAAGLAVAFGAAAVSGDGRLLSAAAGTLPMALAALVSWRRAFGAQADAPLRWMPVAAGTAAVLGIAGAVALLPLEIDTDVWLFKDPGPDTLVVLSGMAIAAAVAEEVIFRGRLLDLVREGAGTAWAVVATSLLFAALHSGIMATPLLKEGQMFLFGVVAAAVRLRTDLRGAVWLHVGHNAVVLIVHWMGVEGQG